MTGEDSLQADFSQSFFKEYLMDKYANTTDPLVVLAFYEGGVILQKLVEGGGVTAFPVDPLHLQEVFSEISFSTPILPGNVLCWGSQRQREIVAWWRPPEHQTLLVEVDGTVQRWRVPLPGFVVVASKSSLSVGALKGSDRPSEESPVYNVPLPNTMGASGHGSVCLGSARLPEEVHVNSLDAVWRTYIESTFGSHSVSGKSVSFPEDVRLLLLQLHEEKAETFPEDDLCTEEQVTLKEWLSKWFD
jgi:PRTRC genetic system protein B